MEKTGFWERASRWVRTSVMLRVITIGILILILLIPVAMIQDLIREREQRQENAINEVSQKWGYAQTLQGLVLSIPYNKYTRMMEDKEEKLVKTKAYAHFLPDTLRCQGQILPEVRYRGIYEVVVYKTALAVSGSFSTPDFSDWGIAQEDILWQEASVSLGLSDLRGIQERVRLQWGAETYDFSPGTETNEVISNGISTRVRLAVADSGAQSNIPFTFRLQTNGSSRLDFVPLGKTTQVTLRSAWKTPSFDGAFLPDEREITGEGFSATWEVLHLNRPYPQAFRGSRQDILPSAFGVRLLVPVDEYQKSMRSAKYAVMFITLTFVLFFFIQILNRIRIHPIQYIIVGLALCVFYTLLIAFSEHIGFGWSYLISSIAIIGMITLYAHWIFKNPTLSRLTGGVLTLLYLFIFSILQLEDYALLMGSVGLFIVLATIMYLSRKIDWYAVGERE